MYSTTTSLRHDLGIFGLFSTLLNLVAFTKPNKHKMRLKDFFYNLVGFVFEYFCDSRRTSATVTKFCLDSLFATWSYRYLNPKHVIQRAVKLPSISHTCFFDKTKLYKPLPLFAVFCVYEVAQSPHKNNMSGANTKSVLARCRDNNWEKGRDFVKTFYVKKLMWEREGSLSARWMTCLGFR